MSSYFNYEALAKIADVDQDMLKELEASVRAQCGADDMMFELRMLRTLSAISEGFVTAKDALLEFEMQDSKKMAA